MTFIDPAVFTPHKDGRGYHAYFPDLDGCEADGPDLEDTIENAREAAYNWLCVELEEESPEFPMVSHEEDIPLAPGEEVRQIMTVIRLLPDND